MPSPLPRICGAVAVCVTAIAITACGSSSSAPTQSTPAATSTTMPMPAAKTVSGQTTVNIVNYKFMPMDLKVTAGTKVTFHNEDGTAHTATGSNFDSGTIAPHSSKTVTLTKPGTYSYKCLFHAFMTASITVVPKA